MAITFKITPAANYETGLLDHNWAHLEAWKDGQPVARTDINTPARWAGRGGLKHEIAQGASYLLRIMKWRMGMEQDPDYQKAVNRLMDGQPVRWALPHLKEGDKVYQIGCAFKDREGVVYDILKNGWVLVNWNWRDEWSYCNPEQRRTLWTAEDLGGLSRG